MTKSVLIFLASRTDGKEFASLRSQRQRGVLLSLREGACDDEAICSIGVGDCTAAVVGGNLFLEVEAMSQLTEKEKTRLSYFVDALVHEPSAHAKLFEIIAERPPREDLARCFTALQEEMVRTFDTGRDSGATVRVRICTVARRLCASNDTTAQTAGHFLCGALEMAGISLT